MQSIVRTGQHSVRVEIECDKDGVEYRVIRKRSRKFNGYIIFREGKKVFRAEALKGEVPEEVTEVLDLSLVTFQSQLEPYFLILDSPGKVGQFFRDLTGTEEIDKVISNLSGKIKRETAKSRVLSEQVEEQEELLQDLQRFPVDKFERLLGEAFRIHRNMESEKTRFLNLEDVVQELEKVIASLSKYPKGVYDIVSDGDSICKSLIMSSDRLAKLFETLEELEDLTDSKRRKFDQKKSFDLVIKGDRLTKELREQIDQLLILCDLAYDLDTCDDNLVQIKARRFVLDQKYKKYVSMLKECPMCSVNLTPRRLEKVIERAA